MTVPVWNVGMLGCGTVGVGLARLLDKHRADFLANGFDLKLSHVAVRDVRKPRGVSLSACRVSGDAMDVALDPEIDLLVEVMGGSTLAVDAGCAALTRGVPLVTANKSALARELGRYVNAARQGGAAIGFEAAVAAHIPIMEALDRSLACEEITLVKGVINGSTNYILSFMEQAGCEYDEALADAAAKGFTEADPSLDVEGIDAAEKLALLAFKAFGAPIPPDLIATQGITRIRQVDIRLAAALGHRIKLVASARRAPGGLSLRVQPALIHRGELLADVDSEFNAIILEGPGFKELTFLGKGAGELPTASAVLNDIVKLARGGAGMLPGFRRAGGDDLRPVSEDRGSQCRFLRAALLGCSPEEALMMLKQAGAPVLRHAVLDGWFGAITDAVSDTQLAGVLADAQLRLREVAVLRLDKDNYREIVEREQRTYFGASLERESGARV